MLNTTDTLSGNEQGGQKVHGARLAQGTSEVFPLNGITVVNGQERNFAIDVLVPNMVGSEILIPNAASPGQYLRLRDEHGLPLVRQAGETSHDAYVRASNAVITYIENGLLEVTSNGSLSPTEKLLPRSVSDTAFVEASSWDISAMYAKNIQSTQKTSEQKVEELSVVPKM